MARPIRHASQGGTTAQHSVPKRTNIGRCRAAGQPGVLAVLCCTVQPLVAGIEPLLGLAKYLAYITLALVLFNLIPGYPLDGGRVFRAIVSAITENMRRATLIAANVGRFFAFLFIFAGVWQTLHHIADTRIIDARRLYRNVTTQHHFSEFGLLRQIVRVAFFSRGDGSGFSDYKGDSEYSVFSRR